MIDGAECALQPAGEFHHSAARRKVVALAALISLHVVAACSSSRTETERAPTDASTPPGRTGGTQGRQLDASGNGGGQNSDGARTSSGGATTGRGGMSPSGGGVTAAGTGGAAKGGATGSAGQRGGAPGTVGAAGGANGGAGGSGSASGGAAGTTNGGAGGHFPAPDGGEATKGLCCYAHSTPGCADPAVEQCVCSMLPECCSKAWGPACEQFIREERCEPDVRGCVCQAWKVATCCDTEWTQACTTSAIERCNANPICP
jgi:hypothetical protein